MDYASIPSGNSSDIDVMRSYIFSALLLLLPFVAAAQSPTSGTGQLPIPKLVTRVTDLAGTLTPEERISLERELKNYEDTTGNQMVVLIIPTLGSEVLEDYSLRVATANQIGQKEQRNGLLVLVAIAEHKIRIEVGYGLEGAIPDVTTALIRENEIAPRFRQGDYFGGLQAGLRALMLAGAGEYRAAPRSAAPDGIGMGTIIMFLIIIFIVSSIIRRGGGGGRRGGGGSILPWIIASRGWGGGGGWGGGSSGGGSSGGGGFSGGGGSFGGGGSSGGW
ncbi:MAG: beta-propeller domain of methanol dehydrogenase type [Chlorobi bacterium]|nr:beta-propeller domain of methanol dehydrogenase type [Chlorobiota bacterium]